MLQNRGVAVFITHLRFGPYKMFERAGIVELIGNESFHSNVADAVAQLNLMRWCFTSLMSLSCTPYLRVLDIRKFRVAIVVALVKIEHDSWKIQDYAISAMGIGYNVVGHEVQMKHRDRIMGQQHY